MTGRKLAEERLPGTSRMVRRKDVAEINMKGGHAKNLSLGGGFEERVGWLGFLKMPRWKSQAFRYFFFFSKSSKSIIWGWGCLFPDLWQSRMLLISKAVSTLKTASTGGSEATWHTDFHSVYQNLTETPEIWKNVTVPLKTKLRGSSEHEPRQNIRLKNCCH